MASRSWRDQLLQEVKVPEVSQSFEIRKYYDFASKVFAQAEEADMVGRKTVHSI